MRKPFSGRDFAEVFAELDSDASIRLGLILPTLPASALQLSSKSTGKPTVPKQRANTTNVATLICDRAAGKLCVSGTETSMSRSTVCWSLSWVQFVALRPLWLPPPPLRGPPPPRFARGRKS